MKGFRELTPDTISHPKVRRVYEYWLSKCAGRAMPAKADIEPMALRDALGNLCLLDVTEETPPRFRFRVDAANLASFTGFNLTGKYADDLPDPAYRQYVLDLYARVVETRAPVFRAAEEDWGGHNVRVESATMPLSSDGSRVDVILDVLFPTEI